MGSQVCRCTVATLAVLMTFSGYILNTMNGFLRKFLQRIVFLSFIGLMESASMKAQAAVKVFAPPEAATILNGNSFFRPFDTSLSGRFQQVYDSSLFSSVPSGGGTISSLSFRPDSG